MILSHKHKFLFLRQTKTAGASLQVALSSYCDIEDIITPLSEDVLKENPGVIDKGQNNVYGWNSHTSYRDVELQFDLSDYKTIVITRNPYEKMISRYYHFLHKNNISESEYSFKRLLQAMIKNAYMPGGYICKDIDVLRDRYDKINYWIRFDSFKEDLTNLELEFNLHGLYSKFKTLNLHRGYSNLKESSFEYYKKNDCLDLAKELKLIYHEEFERFDYQLHV